MEKIDEIIAYGTKIGTWKEAGKEFYAGLKDNFVWCVNQSGRCVNMGTMESVIQKIQGKKYNQEIKWFFMRP